jgi:hypothetical protein
MIDIESITDLFLDNLKINWIFYLGLLLSLYVFSAHTKTSLVKNILSFILISLAGYFIHLMAHQYDYKILFEKAIEHNSFLTRSDFMKDIVRWTGELVSFHDDVHHDTEINKNWDNQIYEFIHNFIAQGLVMFVAIIIFRNLNPKIALIWGLYYATIHIINYNFVQPEVHKQHHEDKHTNYGLDVWDVLFNTKFDKSLENYNHSVVNVMLLFFIFYKLIY